ncbi:uncharacterized protein N7477_000900 [Penicillium maclennaniae]|uniref:uncharacterized protein n=1 Tax=Penicillium maclennaniae TaxID=1343394 RepID=UPI0025411BE0|nr:uncharacterized protein N7477_000900 [Penicillium maclennaniae]KAJ5684555.1 hypothetical protein N7477_000900 [Penicillium maclennaniae]
MGPRRSPRTNTFSSQDCQHGKRSDSVASFESPSSTQPKEELQNPTINANTHTDMDLPVNYETVDGGSSLKRRRTFLLEIPSGSSAFSQGNQSSSINSSPMKSSPVKSTPIKQEKCQPLSRSPIRKRPFKPNKSTPTQATLQPQSDNTPRAEFEIVKLRAELSQLRLDFDIEKQRNEALRSQFEVERCLNEFLRGQTIAEQNLNKSLLKQITALEQRMDRLEPTFVTIQHLKQVLLTWLRDYLVHTRTESGDSSQQVGRSQQ